MSERYLHVKEAAAALRISMPGFYRILGSNRGPPAIRIGNVWRLPESKFLEWLKNGGTPKNIAGNRGILKNGKSKKCSASR